MAAQNVQVIHTSCDEGTLQRDAHQDWLMGDCGINQAAAANSSFMQPLQMPSKTSEPIYIPFSRENHDMCPLFYLSAFENTFEAVVNPCCLGSNRDAAPAPSNYSMGYMQPDKGFDNEEIEGFFLNYIYVCFSDEYRTKHCMRIRTRIHRIIGRMTLHHHWTQSREIRYRRRKRKT